MSDHVFPYYTFLVTLMTWKTQHGGLMGFNGDYRGLINKQQGCQWIYPLVNTQKAMEKSPF